MKNVIKNIRIKYDNSSIIDTTYDLTMEALGYVDVNYDYVIPVKYNDYLGRYKSDELFTDGRRNYYFTVSIGYNRYYYHVYSYDGRHIETISDGDHRTLRGAIEYAIYDLVRHSIHFENMKVIHHNL